MSQHGEEKIRLAFPHILNRLYHLEKNWLYLVSISKNVFIWFVFRKHLITVNFFLQYDIHFCKAPCWLRPKIHIITKMYSVCPWKEQSFSTTCMSTPLLKHTFLKKELIHNLQPVMNQNNIKDVDTVGTENNKLFFWITCTRKTKNVQVFIPTKH